MWKEIEKEIEKLGDNASYENIQSLLDWMLDNVPTAQLCDICCAMELTQ